MTDSKTAEEWAKELGFDVVDCICPDLAATYPDKKPTCICCRVVKALKSYASDKDKRIAELEAEVAEFQSLLDLQHTRTGEAEKLWQLAHNEPLTKPDLGRLVEWILLSKDKVLLELASLKSSLAEMKFKLMESEASSNLRFEQRNKEKFQSDIYAKQVVLKEELINEQSAKLASLRQVAQGLREQIRQIVIDDVPHRYQTRLLEALDGTR